MSKRTVLVADNHDGFLSGCAANVRSAGFKVMVAHSGDEVRAAIETGLPHVVVLDVRLENDADDGDLTGLDLINDIPESIGIILQSSWMELGVVTAANRVRHCHYVDKSQENAAELLIEEIERIFQSQVGINFGLRWLPAPREELSLVSLAAALMPGQPSDGSYPRITELDDLLRKTLSAFDHARLLRLLWLERGSRACILARCIQSGIESSHIILVGARHADHPAAASAKVHDTVHFFGCLVELDADPNTLFALSDLYPAHDRRLRAGLNHLLKSALRAQRWRVAAPPEPDPITPAAWRLQFLWPATSGIADGLTAAVAALCTALAHHNGQIRVEDGGLSIQVGNVRQATLPHPASALPRAAALIESGEVLVSPCVIDLRRVLLDSADRSWLVEPQSAAPAPVEWDFAAVEASLRFDLGPRATDEDWLKNRGEAFEFELHLRLQGPTMRGPASNDDMLPSHRILATAVGEVRRRAQEAGADADRYRACLLSHIAQRILKTPVSALSREEACVATSLIIASGMLAEDLGGGHAPLPSISTPSAGQAILIEDAQRRIVKVLGERLKPLSPLEFALLDFLLKRPNAVCSFEDIFADVFRQRWNGSRSQRQQLHIAVARLRDAIEPDRSEPRFIKSEHSQGYWIDLRP